MSGCFFLNTVYIWLLHDSPDLVVDGIQIWTVWQPEVRTDSQVSSAVAAGWCRGCDVPKCCLVKDKCVVCDTFDR